MKKFLVCIALTSLAGCSVTVPVVAKKQDGMVFIGQAKAGLSQSEGTMELYNDETGEECHGVYDQWSSDSLLRVKLTCSDGSVGTANMMRTKDTLHGSGEGYMTHPDGTRERVLAAFGDNVLREHNSPAFWRTVGVNIHHTQDDEDQSN